MGFTVLDALRRQDGFHMRMQQLARAAALSPSATTRLVNRLEERALLTRVLCADDRRGLYTELTHAGQALLERATPIHAAALEGALAEAHEVPNSPTWPSPSSDSRARASDLGSPRPGWRPGAPPPRRRRPRAVTTQARGGPVVDRTTSVGGTSVRRGSVGVPAAAPIARPTARPPGADLVVVRVDRRQAQQG